MGQNGLQAMYKSRFFRTRSKGLNRGCFKVFRGSRHISSIHCPVTALFSLDAAAFRRYCSLNVTFNEFSKENRGRSMDESDTERQEEPTGPDWHPADVLAALKLCAGLDIAVIPFGGGTGRVTPARGRHRGCPPL